jgi:hypothetical protein
VQRKYPKREKREKRVSLRKWPSKQAFVGEGMGEK